MTLCPLSIQTPANHQPAKWGLATHKSLKYSNTKFDLWADHPGLAIQIAYNQEAKEALKIPYLVYGPLEPPAPTPLTEKG
jgi:hypothetical protein